MEHPVWAKGKLRVNQGVTYVTLRNSRSAKLRLVLARRSLPSTLDLDDLLSAVRLRNFSHALTRGHPIDAGLALWPTRFQLVSLFSTRVPSSLPLKSTR
jgi:hypothetical protein